MANIRKRGASWFADVNMRGHRLAQSFPTKGQAQQWAAEIERRIRSGRGLSIHGRTMEDALMRYSEEISEHKRSRAWEQKRILWLCSQTFASMPLHEIAAPTIAAWRDARRKEVSGSTVNRDFNLLSHVFTVARKEWRWIDHNPCSDVRRPKSNAPRARRVSPAELQALYTFTTSDIQTVSFRTILAFEFAIETACRGGEICTIERDQLSGRVLTLEKTKNGDSREVPLSGRALEILKMVLPLKLSPVFGITVAQKDAMFRKLRGRAGLEDLNFHDSRHEAITRLARKLDVLDLARMVGHRDIRQLMTYYNPTPEEIASRLD